MPYRRNARSKQTGYYARPQRPYYVKKKPGAIITRIIVMALICITLLTGGAIKSDYDVLADIYPQERILPELVAKEEEENKWVKNLVPPLEDMIYMAWQDKNKEKNLEHVRPGVNVYAPTWFSIEEDPVTGAATAKNLLQLGNTKWNPNQYVEFCHANDIKVWGTLVCLGEADLARQVVTDMEMQQKIISQLVEWTIAYNLDGISLDFEYMDSKYIDEFTQFAKNIKDALPSNQNIVSVAVTVKLTGDTSGNWWQSYDRGGLAEVIDYVAVMAYEDGGGSLEPRAGIDWVETHVKRLLEEMLSNKLILGIPFWGIDYIGKVIDSDSFNVDPLWKNDKGYRLRFFSDDLVSALANGEYVDVNSETVYVSYWLDKGSWNEEYGISQYSFVDTEGYLHTVYIDDESSLYQKADLAKRYGLAGVGVWQEYFGYDGMWEALADGLS